MTKLGGLFDGPIRTRVVWWVVFKTAVFATGELCTAAGLACIDLVRFEPAANMVLDALVFIGVLHASTGVTPVDDAERAWTNPLGDV